MILYKLKIRNNLFVKSFILFLQILNIYFSRESPNNWKMPLIEALEKIRRPDLKELVLRLLCSENI